MGWYTLGVDSTWSRTHRMRTALGFLVFAAAAGLMIYLPIAQLQRTGWQSSVAGGRPWLTGAEAVVCATSLILLLRLARSLRKYVPATVALSLLWLCLALFGLQTIIGLATRAPWLTLRLMLTEVLLALVDAILILWFLARWDAAHNTDKFREAAEHSLDDFYLFDGVTDDKGELIDFRFRYVNPNVERRLRLHRDALLGRLLTEVRPNVTTSGLLEDYFYVVRTGEPYNRELFFDDELIRATWIHVHAVRVGNGLAVTSRDVTDSKRKADYVSYLAHYDQLTGLPNRTLLEDRLEQAIVRGHRQQHKVAVFLVDIDQFKEVNDSFGHAGGDELLIAVSRRLRSCVRESDTVARLGGDEFVVVMPDFKTIDEVRACGRQLVEQVAQPISIEGREVLITISVGVCLYPDAGSNARQLLKNADTAMYVVKGTGRNGLNLYADPQANDPVVSTEG